MADAKTERRGIYTAQLIIAPAYHNELCDEAEATGRTIENIMSSRVEQYGQLTTQLAEATARVEKLEDALVNREQRRIEILEWLEDRIGTSWHCDCGTSTYHSSMPECQECGREMPLPNWLAFKLCASETDGWQFPDSSQRARASSGEGERDAE